MPYSPPVAKPWINRQNISSTAAQTPIVSRVGRQAMTKEAAAITDTEMVSAVRRPCRSANRPKYQEPTGRITKVTANTAYT